MPGPATTAMVRNIAAAIITGMSATMDFDR